MMATKMAPGELLKPVRDLHWVFKIADRAASLEFYRDTLGMTVLRHEEVGRSACCPGSPTLLPAAARRRFTSTLLPPQFTEGCAASCNGPYAGGLQSSLPPPLPGLLEARWLMSHPPAARRHVEQDDDRLRRGGGALCAGAHVSCALGALGVLLAAATIGRLEGSPSPSP